MTIGLVATLKVQDGKGPELEAVFRELAPLVRANEPGNLLYQLTKSRTDANTYKVLEIYQDQEALGAHGASEHFKALSPKMGACLAGRPDLEFLDSVD
ncbi:putative quinol monooxygenase [Caulobacter sp. KR2-114]|uniref:putative quinol monooxygenase n=1 Tax=Caulobacter sp. KR2-114 TaxID=3400912 RepID=UPI003BFDD4A5